MKINKDDWEQLRRYRKSTLLDIIENLYRENERLWKAYSQLEQKLYHKAECDINRALFKIQGGDEEC